MSVLLVSSTESFFQFKARDYKLLILNLLVQSLLSTFLQVWWKGRVHGLHERICGKGIRKHEKISK